jgi:outer membrane protein assembly factor BamB
LKYSRALDSITNEREIKMTTTFNRATGKSCLISGMALLLIAAPALSQPANTPWPQFHQNQWNTGYQSQYAWPVGATVGLNELIGGQITGSPVIRKDGALIVGVSRGVRDTLYCIHPDSTPKILWKYSSGIGGYIYGAAAVSQAGYVYFGSRDNYFTILNASDGSFVKSWNVGGDVDAPPAIAANGRIYFGDPVSNGYLNCIDGVDLKWSLALSSKIYTSSPAVRGDTVYIGGGAGLINAMYAVTDQGASGAVKWFCRIWSTPGSIYSSPAVTNDTIYFTSNNGKFYMLRDTGASYDTTAIQIGLPLAQTVFVYRSSPAIGPDGTVYVGVPWAVRGPGDTTGCLVAINPNAKGLAVKWRYWIGGFNAKTSIFSSPAIDANGRIFFGGQDGTFYVLEDLGASANLRWSYATGGALRSSPAIGDDGTVYIGSYDGRLYGFGPANPLAVEMSFFTLAAVANGVQLNWRTESETNCDHWKIERSVNKDGGFEEIGKIPGRLSTNEPHEYSYTDNWKLETGIYYYRLAEVDVNNNKTYYGPLMVEFGGKNLPLSYNLEKAYPNPAVSSITIKYALMNTGRVSLKIYNVLGQELRALVNGVQPAGYYTLVWDGKDSRGQRAANGIYLYRLSAAGGEGRGDYTTTRKVTVLR